MEIFVNTDHTLQGHETFSDQVKEEVNGVLGHLSEHLTRVEVHLSDETGHKSSADAIKCLIEARIKKHQPVTVRVHAETVSQAVVGASRKLVTVIEGIRGRAADQRGPTVSTPPKTP